MSTAALATVSDIVSDLRGYSAKIEKVLPPASMGVERFLQLCWLTLNRNKDLLACTRHSLIDSVFRAAELGLDPSGQLGSAYIVPFVVKGSKVASLIPGYRGFIDLMVRTGEVRGVKAVLVRWDDEFDLEEGDRPRLYHKPWYPKTPEEQAATVSQPRIVRGAYAVAQLPDKSRQFHFMDFRALEAVRLKAPGGKSENTPWATHREEMYRKTPIRALAKSIAINPVKAGLLALAERFDEHPLIRRAETRTGQWEETGEEEIEEAESSPVKPAESGAAKAKRMLIREEAYNPADLVPAPPDDVKLPGAHPKK